MKTLGLDLGTNSIGWAIVERDGKSVQLLDKGVHIFQEGVARVKGNEEPAVKTRTDARSIRRHYFRRRLRKVDLLRILVREGWCPKLSDEDLSKWKAEKKYPLQKDFLEWQRTDDGTGKNPYHDRYVCLTRPLDLVGSIADRYTLGRALYHLNQRRGFLSNRKDKSSEEEDGNVKTGIKTLDGEIQAAGCSYLGEYFYKLYGTGQKIRKQYTARIGHYEKEFYAICEKQGLPETLVQELHRIIFYQRPLKSQKGLVGHCKFEKNKARCPLSHPDFEEFRMLSLVNNIRIARPGDESSRPLNDEERRLIGPLFYRKSKAHFDFSEIAQKLAGKKAFILYSKNEDNTDAFRFNYRESTTVSGCPFTAWMRAVFGEDWKSELMRKYALAGSKTERQVINDVWHVLFNFDSDDKVIAWAKNHLGLDDKEAEEFAKTPVAEGYAALSLKAIDRILPWLRKEYRYDKSVMMANAAEAMGKDVRTDPAKLEEAMAIIKDTVVNYVPNPEIKNDSKYRKIEESLSNAGLFDFDMDKFYHPSMIETFPKVIPAHGERALLQSPRTDSVRNPMAMRALFRMRALVNELIKQGEIDQSTRINLELSRNLNEANRRKAIEQYQRDNEKRRAEYRERIAEYFESSGKSVVPSEEDVLKYELWEEQKHICLYTGKTIRLSDFLGADPTFDIEHTIPRSVGGDDSKGNKTLCDNRFNRDVKKGSLPSELANAKEILARVESLKWEEQIDSLRREMERQKRNARAAGDKESKDRAIVRGHLARMKYDYLSDKLARFTMKEVPTGFTNRQGVDIGIIGRYARMYLLSVFDRVYTVKGETTAAFRKMWGVQNNYQKKERVNHSHHCIDAITIACIGRQEYDQWAHYKEDYDQYEFYGKPRPAPLPKPWPTFTEDVQSISEELLVSHYTPDHMNKPARKKMRVRGIIQKNPDGKPKYERGDSARGSLHLQTFYGAIERDGEIRYVVRRELASLDAKDIANIVDDAVREKVADAVQAHGIGALKEEVWMNEEKRIPIRKVRVFAPTVKNPIALKAHRDKSEQEYKSMYYVTNDANYAMGLYEGVDDKGKRKKECVVLSVLDVTKKHGQNAQSYLFPLKNEKGLDLKYVMKLGKMVLFYEKSKEELYDCTEGDLAKRLYKLVGINAPSAAYPFGKLVFVHHQEARPSGEVKKTNGQWKSGEEYRPGIVLLHTQFDAMVEGRDFILDSTGKVSFL